LIYHHFAELSAVVLTIFISPFYEHLCYRLNDQLLPVHITYYYYYSDNNWGSIMIERKRVCSGEALMGCLNERLAEHASVRLPVKASKVSV